MKLSIITVNKDNYLGLKKTVVSVLNQTLDKSAFEYIVVDGASSDGSVDFLSECADRIDKLISEKDTGIYNAMNKGVSLSSGEYCLFLNSGDVLHNERVLEDVFPCLNKYQIIAGRMLMLDDRHIWIPRTDVSLRGLYEGSIPHNSTFISRNTLNLFPYDEKYRISSDWKFWVQSLVLNECSYSTIDILVTDFDCEGISAKNRSLSKIERDNILQEMIPKRILINYVQFLKGGGYQETSYDRFYINIRDTKYGKILFRLNKMIIRVVALFLRSARPFSN